MKFWKLVFPEYNYIKWSKKLVFLRLFHAGFTGLKLV